MEKKTSNKGRFWMLFPVVLLVTSVSGWLFMVRLAVDDPGFSVEKDYYKKAAHYDDEIAQRANNERLGWSIEVSEFTVEESGVVLRLRAADGGGVVLNGLRLSATAFPTARGNEQKELTFTDLGEGRYEAHLGRARRGLWEVRLRAESGVEVFTQTLRPELALGEKPRGDRAS